jgi:hypothetical protein
MERMYVTYGEQIRAAGLHYDAADARHDHHGAHAATTLPALDA